jgi:Tol biopolymer transport system component
MQPAHSPWSRLLDSLAGAAPALTAAIIMMFAVLAPVASVAAQAPSEGPHTQIRIDGDDVIAAQTALSHDGRWLAGVSRDGVNNRSLWIAPAAGGERVRLTSAGYLDTQPNWSPAGDRIFFTSNRPSRGESGTFVMTLRIDPQTGNALDEPRQVTLERGSSSPDVSPDGRSVLYRTGLELRVVPAMGGTSRVVATVSNSGLIAWAPSGDSIYYAAWDTEQGIQSLYRQSLSGGSPLEVLRPTDGRVFTTAFAPAVDRLATIVPSDQGGRTVEVLDFAGRVIAHHSNSRLWPIRFSADGATLISSTSNTGTIIRVQAIAGGDPIDLPNTVGSGQPVAWTADSRAVIATGVVDGISAVRILPLEGSASRAVKVPAGDARVQFLGPQGASATHATYRVQVGDDRNHHRLFALDLATGERTLLTEGSATSASAGSDGFNFREQVGDQIHWRSAAPGRPTRTFYSAPADFAAERSYDFHGDRVAYTDLVGDSLAVMIEDSPGAAPRALATLGVPTRPDACCRVMLKFSPDGQWIVADLPDPPGVATATLIRVPDQGRATDVRNVSLDAEFWYNPRWTPDSQGVTVIAANGNSRAWVAFVPTAPGERVRHISRADDSSAWDFALSPDGRYVAYMALGFRGGSLWRMEVP